MVKTVNASPIVCILRGSIAALLTSLLMIPISAWLLTYSDDPDPLIYIVPKAVQILSGLIGGVAVAKCKGSKGIIDSVISAGVYSAIIIIGAIIGSSDLLITLLMTVFIIASFILGAIIGAPHEKSKNAKRKEMLKRLK